jgi:hypothetical protein
MSQSFSVTWDYRCPFARIAHDHILTGLEAGADWDVTCLAFSLDQSHVEEGATPVWDEPERYPGMLPNLAGIVVRDRQPELFRRAHRALFSARHDESLDLRDRAIVGKVMDSVGIDGAGVLAEIDDGWPLLTARDEHSKAVDEHAVFGVPTFIVGAEAAFVRLMRGPRGNSQVAIRTVEKVLDMLDGWPELNEFKHTTISN